MTADCEGRNCVSPTDRQQAQRHIIPYITSEMLWGLSWTKYRLLFNKHCSKPSPLQSPAQHYKQVYTVSRFSRGIVLYKCTTPLSFNVAWAHWEAVYCQMQPIINSQSTIDTWAKLMSGLISMHSTLLTTLTHFIHSRALYIWASEHSRWTRVDVSGCHYQRAMNKSINPFISLSIIQPINQSSESIDRCESSAHWLTIEWGGLDYPLRFVDCLDPQRGPLEDRRNTFSLWPLTPSPTQGQKRKDTHIYPWTLMPENLSITVQRLIQKVVRLQDNYKKI